jgi:hypothetical protein
MHWPPVALGRDSVGTYMRESALAMGRILIPLAVFLAYLAVVGIGTSAPRGSVYFRITDLTLLSLHLGFVFFMSALVLHHRWADGRRPRSRPTMHQRVIRWITDDQN